MTKLNSILLCVIATFCIAAVITEPATINDLPVLYTQTASSVVYIEGNQSFTGNRRYASGFIVNSSKGWIVTAYHVNELEKKKIILPSGKIISCETVIEDKENDIAIVKVAPLLLKDYREVELSKKSYIGEMIYSIGFPAGFDSIITLGILSSGINNKDVGKPSYPDGFYVSDLLTAGGSSGSPAFNLEGKVIGMISAKYGGLTVIVPAASIQNLINSIN
jgi:serine protease Do